MSPAGGFALIGHEPQEQRGRIPRSEERLRFALDLRVEGTFDWDIDPHRRWSETSRVSSAPPRQFDGLSLVDEREFIQTTAPVMASIVGPRGGRTPESSTAVAPTRSGVVEAKAICRGARATVELPGCQVGRGVRKQNWHARGAEESTRLRTSFLRRSRTSCRTR